MCKEQYVSDSFDGVFRDTYIVDLMGTIAFTHEGVSPTTHSNRLFTDPMLPESCLMINHTLMMTSESHIKKAYSRNCEASSLDTQRRTNLVIPDRLSKAKSIRRKNYFDAAECRTCIPRDYRNLLLEGPTNASLWLSLDTTRLEALLNLLVLFACFLRDTWTNLIEGIFEVSHSHSNIAD
jgi:hypothetical protein